MKTQWIVLVFNNSTIHKLVDRINDCESEGYSEIVQIESIVFGGVLYVLVRQRFLR